MAAEWQTIGPSGKTAGWKSLEILEWSEINLWKAVYTPLATLEQIKKIEHIL